MDDLTLDTSLSEARPDAILAQARQRLVAGKIAAASGDFSTAGVELQQAQSMLDAVPLDATDQAAQHLHDEIAAVASIVALAERAESERTQGQHDRALAALAEAGQLLKQGGDPEIATAIEALRLRIAGERKRIEEEEQQIVRGDRFLAQRSLDKAAARFRAACEALLPDTRRRAEKRLQQVQKEIQAFEDDVRQARQTTDLLAAAEAWQRAYDRWPTERSAAAGLTDALAHAGEATLAEGHEETARGYFERALRLKPKDEKASAGMEQLARSEQIRASITRTRDEIDQLTQRGVPTADDDLNLRERLAELSAETNELPALGREIAGLLEELDQRQQHGRAIAVADEQAAQLALAGDWDNAIELHAAALAALGDPPPALVVRRHTAWQDARATSATAAREGTRLLEAAQAAYEAGRNAGDFAEVVAKTATIDQLIDAAARRTQTVGVRLPSELQTLSAAANVLRRRAEAAELALDTATAQQGLNSVREALRALGEDATLRRIEADLANQRSQQVPNLLLQAQQAEEQDAISDALDYLRQAREIDPDNPDLAERLEQITRRRRFEEALRRAEVDAEVAGSSLTATRNALRRGLEEVFLNPEFAVSDPTRATIRELIALADEDSGEGFADAEKWRHARELREHLLSHEGWVDRRAAQFADQWIQVAREAALRGAIASLAALGDMLGAYRTAFNYRRIYQSEEAIYHLERAQEGLRLSLISQADKLLSRARQALDGGEYATALENLQILERDYYEPIEREFPFLLPTLDEYQEISQSRRDAQELRKQAEQLQQQAESIKQALQEVESAFMANQFVEAEQALQAIVHNDRLTYLKQLAESLATRIERSRKQQARRQLGDQLAAARSVLKTETDYRRLDELLANLEQFDRRLDWEALVKGDRTEFNAMIDQVGEARTTLSTIAAWEDDARQARNADDYERAAQSLQNAIKVTQETTAAQVGGRGAQLQAQFNEIEGLMRRQRNRQTALQEGRRLLGMRDYAGAIEAFALAQSFGADIEALQKTAQAGELLQRARAAWEAKSGLAAARDDLDLADRLVKDNPEATIIAQELDYFRGRISQRIDDIQSALQGARAALAQDDLSAADEHIRNILSWDTTQPEALRLQHEHQTRAKIRADDTLFRTLLERSEQERKRGNDRTALTFIEDALKLQPNDAVAINLQVDLTREHEANEVLRQARAEIYGGKFLSATQLIRVGEAHASPGLLEEVRRLLEDLETAYRTNTVYPIRDLLRDERYREALRRCTDTLKYVESEQLRAELNDLISTIVKRWIDKSISLAQSQLRNATEERTFSDVAEGLWKLEQELAAYPESQQINHQIRQANIGRLNLRLENIETILQQRALLYRAGSAEPVDVSVGGIAVASARTLEQIQSLAGAALAEAEAMQLVQLSARARTLLETIDERMRFEQAQDARVLLKRASSRPTPEQANKDLDQAHDLMENVLKHDRFRNDQEMIELLDQIGKAQRAIRQTRDGLGRAEQALSSGRFEDAQRQLRRIGTAYPLLQPRYDQLIKLLELLGRAEELADKQKWREAFALYHEAARLEPTLELLSRKIGHCQEQITEQIRQESRAALRALPPDPEVARALLSEAEKAGWLDPSASGEIASLRKWITSRKRAVDAITLLDPAHAEPERALDMLREALQIYSDPESDEQIAQWMVFAQALQDWQAHNLNTAHQSLGMIHQPVATMPYVRAARRIVKDQLLGELRDQARRALQAWNPDLAAQSIAGGLRIDSNDSELRDLSVRQQQIIQRAPELRKRMEAGWQALERVPKPTDEDGDWGHVQEAQQAFEQALQIDEQFAAASQWLLFAQSIEGGLRLSQQRNDNDARQSFETVGQLFEAAGESFERAAGALEANADDPPPTLLGSAKRQNDRRRHAVDAAAQLATVARVLAKLYHDAYTYEQKEDVDKVYPTVVEIDQQQQLFIRLCRNPLVPSTNQYNRRTPKAASQPPSNGTESTGLATTIQNDDISTEEDNLST